MANALGQLPNAPLIYVLAQVRFTHIPRMDKRWEDFHAKVFESYPKADPERIEQITFKDGQPTVGDTIQRWHMLNKNRTTGIILDAGMLIFHTTDYQTSNVFLSELQNILNTFRDTFPEKGVSVSRLGLRYVDLLVQEEGLSVDQQVIPTLRLPTPADIGEAIRMDQLVTYRTPMGGTMLIRHRQSTSPDVLPADVFPNKLEPAPRLKREHPDNAIVGLLDYDHFFEQEQSFDIESITTNFRQLRDVSSAAFKATTTPKARTVWEKEAH